MKRTIIYFLSVLVSAGLFAQSKSVSTEVKYNSIVVLQDLEGSVTVENWNKSYVEVTTENGSDLKVFKAEDKVFVSAENADVKNAKYTVRLPKNVKLDWYSKDSDLNIKGQFLALKVENQDGSTVLDLQNENAAMVYTASIEE